MISYGRPSASRAARASGRAARRCPARRARGRRPRSRRAAEPPSATVLREEGRAPTTSVASTPSMRDVPAMPASSTAPTSLRRVQAPSSPIVRSRCRAAERPPGARAPDRRLLRAFSVPDPLRRASPARDHPMRSWATSAGSTLRRSGRAAATCCACSRRRTSPRSTSRTSTCPSPGGTLRLPGRFVKGEIDKLELPAARVRPGHLHRGARARRGSRGRARCDRDGCCGRPASP